MDDASVIIPTKNAGSQFRAVLTAVTEQAGDNEVLVVDSGSTDCTLDVVAEFPVDLLEIDPESYGHGATRNRAARQTDGSVLVFLTQDAEPEPGWLAGLLEPLASDESVAGTYSRQLPRPSATPMRRYLHRRFYPPEPRYQQLNGDESFSLDDIFFSNVSSAIRRSVWERYPFREDVLVSEDRHWAKTVLEAGHAIRYSPESRVRHSHRPGIKELFQRYVDVGASVEPGDFDGADGGFLSNAVSYQLGQCRYLFRAGHYRWLPYLPATEAAKFLGLVVGKRLDAAPDWLARRLSFTLQEKHEH